MCFIIFVCVSDQWKKSARHMQVLVSTVTPDTGSIAGKRVMVDVPKAFRTLSNSRRPGLAPITQGLGFSRIFPLAASKLLGARR